MWHLEVFRGSKLFTGLRMKMVYMFAREVEDLCRYK